MTESFSESLAQRSIEARERPIFEGWVKTVHPSRWPNPSDYAGMYFIGGEYIGQYYNVSLNAMWQSWLARALLASPQSAKAGVENG